MDFSRQDLVKLAVDTSRGKLLNDYSKADAEESVRQAFIQLMGTDKPTPRDFRDNQNRIFSIIEDIIDQTVTEGFNTPFFQQFVDMRNIARGDEQTFYVEDNTPLLVSKHAGNHWDIRAQKLNIGDTFTLATTPYAVKIEGDFLRFITGRLDWGRFVSKVSEAFNQQLQNDIYDSFIASAQYLPAEFNKSASFAEKDLLTLAAHVQASNQTSNVVLAGTKVALSQLTDVTVLSDSEKASLNQNGIVSIWKGYSLLPITQSHKPGTFEFQIADDRIFVMPSGPKPIKVVHEGNPMLKQVSDGTTNMDMSMEYAVLDKFGIATIFNQFYGQYKFA